MRAEELLDGVRNDQDITYGDEAVDKKLLEIINRGMNYLNNIAGGELDYSEGSPNRSLLYDYCRYARNKTLELFEGNFQSELIALRMGKQVDDYAKEQGYV